MHADLRVDRGELLVEHPLRVVALAGRCARSYVGARVPRSSQMFGLPSSLLNDILRRGLGVQGCGVSGTSTSRRCLREILLTWCLALVLLLILMLLIILLIGGNYIYWLLLLLLLLLLILMTSTSRRCLSCDVHTHTAAQTSSTDFRLYSCRCTYTCVMSLYVLRSLTQAVL